MKINLSVALGETMSHTGEPLHSAQPAWCPLDLIERCFFFFLN